MESGIEDRGGGTSSPGGRGHYAGYEVFLSNDRPRFADRARAEKAGFPMQLLRLALEAYTAERYLYTNTRVAEMILSTSGVSPTLWKTTTIKTGLPPKLLSLLKVRRPSAVCRTLILPWGMGGVSH